jgi:hypothetical protein
MLDEQALLVARAVREAPEVGKKVRITFGFVVDGRYDLKDVRHTYGRLKLGHQVVCVANRAIDIDVAYIALVYARVPTEIEPRRCGARQCTQ